MNISKKGRENGKRSEEGERKRWIATKSDKERSKGSERSRKTKKNERNGIRENKKSKEE